MKNVQEFNKMKSNGEKITMVTAYDYPTGKFAEHADVDMILVGDSLGMVVLGYDSTIPVTLDDMVHHTKAVRRGAKDTFIVADLPFMTYHGPVHETLKNAARLMQEAGANAVKLEGADDVVMHIDKLTSAGIPVVAHLGLTPQSVAVLGGYKVQGKDTAHAEKLIEDAIAVENAGAMMLVLECIPRQLGELISKKISIPTIGIGAGLECDGQVLVYHDIVGYGVDRLPKFVKSYTNVQEPIIKALSQYNEDVKTCQFPQLEHTFTMKEENLESLYGGRKK